MIPKERITELWNQASDEIIDLWQADVNIIFRDHFVRLIEKEINDKQPNSRTN